MIPYQTKELYNQGLYDGLIALWEDETERTQFNEWDYSYVMNACYKQKLYEKCLQVYKSFHRRYPASDRLDDKMGWSLYQTQIKRFDFFHGDRNRFIQQVDYVIAHSTSGAYSPRFRVIRCMVEAILSGKMGPEYDLRKGLDYLNKAAPETLSADPPPEFSVNDRNVTLASEREIWYTLRSKLLLKLRDYEDCVACCDQAMNAGFEMHNQNDVWFLYRRTKALQGLGRTEEAEAYVRKLMADGVQHWCLLQVLFELYRDTGRVKDAHMTACLCSLYDRQHDMRVSFYAEFADFLEVSREGSEEEIMLLRQLVILIREGEGWSLTNTQLAWQISDEIKALDVITVLAKLDSCWKLYLETNPKETGN